MLTVTIKFKSITNDGKNRFLDVFVGCPSKVHDARVFRLSEKLPQICSSQFHLLVDSAYSLREYLLKPYRDFDNLTASYRNYNLRFCATRVKIEKVLKARFRQLMRLDFQTVAAMALL